MNLLDADADIRIQFSTEQYPERDRLAVWSEVFGRTVAKVDMRPLSTGPFRQEVMIRVLPGLAIKATTYTTGYIAERQPNRLSNGGTECVILAMPQAGSKFASQMGREVSVGAGEAVLGLTADPGMIVVSAGTCGLSLVIPRSALEPMVRNLDDVLLRPLQAGREPLRLLSRYVQGLQEDVVTSSPELRRVFVAHVRDLVALALNPSRDSIEAAQSGGLRAARLRAIKEDVLANLDRHDLSAETVALRNRISPRYLRLLFAAEGASFSDFVREQRLARVHKMLSAPGAADRKISVLAYDAGFSDLSHFNRSFRQFYGVSPSDVRAAASAREPR